MERCAISLIFNHNIIKVKDGLKNRQSILLESKIDFHILQPNSEKIMGVTRLKRKDRRNKSKANARVKRIKQLTLTPVIRKIDVEELKKSFSATV